MFATLHGQANALLEQINRTIGDCAQRQWRLLHWQTYDRGHAIGAWSSYFRGPGRICSCTGGTPSIKSVARSATRTSASLRTAERVSECVSTRVSERARVDERVSEYVRG